MSNARFFPYLSTDEISNFPSLKNGIDQERELTYRQLASAFIQELGHRLQCTQCTMNTAIVYMHRFYYLNSFTKFHRNTMAPACLFLACKVEEQPRKVEHIIKAVHRILYRDKPAPELNSQEYVSKAEELVVNENILLQTLGFRIIVDHPHPHIVRYCDRHFANSSQVVQVAWFLATNSLHLTTFCLQHPPTIIAVLCIYLSCKYISCPLQSRSNQPWWYDIDRNASEELLNKLAYEFVAIMDKAPTKYKTIKGSRIGSESLLGQGSTQSGANTSTNEETSNAKAFSADKPRQEKPIVKEEIDEIVKDSTKPHAGTEDALSSPPRKVTKVGTEKLSLKDYMARKATQDQGGESPLKHKPVNTKTAPSSPQASSDNKPPAPVKDLPILQPLTLSMDTVSNESKGYPVSEPSGNTKKPKIETDRPRQHHHHHHHSHHKHSSNSAGEEVQKTHLSADRHHRHHSHHRAPHRTQMEKKNSSSDLSALKADSHRVQKHEQNNGNKNGDSKALSMDSSVPKEDPMLSCHTLLATPPSPPSNPPDV